MLISFAFLGETVRLDNERTDEIDKVDRLFSCNNNDLLFDLLSFFLIPFYRFWIFDSSLCSSIIPSSAP